MHVCLPEYRDRWKRGLLQLERDIVCVCVREKEIEIVCVCVCACVCACVCVCPVCTPPMLPDPEGLCASSAPQDLDPRQGRSGRWPPPPSL